MSYEFKMIDVVIFVAGCFLLFLFIKIFKKRDSDFVNKKEIQASISKIIKLLNHNQEMNYRLAVIEADKLLDYVLQKMKFTGDTMAQRLKLATFKYPKLKKVWWAHKVRNLLVHDVHYKIKFSVANKVIKIFKQALKELNAI